MANRSGRGLALLIVAMLAAAVWWRFRSRGSDPADNPQAAVSIADASAGAIDAPPHEVRDVHVVAVDATVTPTARRTLRESGYRLVRLSLDGKLALLHRDTNQLATAPSYRVIVVDTGALEAEVELATFKLGDSDEPFSSDDERAADVLRTGPLLARFPLGAGGPIAVSPDGKSAAFNIGDELHVVTGGKRRKLPLPAAYDPMMLADGQTLLFRGYDGRVAGPHSDGKYSLFWVPLAGGKPQKVAGSDTVHDWRLSRSGDVLRIVVGELPAFAGCVLEVPLVKPFKVTRKRCVDNDEIEMSPTGDWLAWHAPATETDATFGGGKATMRIRALELSTGKLGLDVYSHGWVALADTGRAVIEGSHAELGALTVHDVANGRVRELALATASSCMFRGGGELVCVDGDRVAVIDLDR